MTTETKYRSAATQLLEQARRELAAGDVRQASEKGWGAAAQAVKSVAETRGWQHKTHGALFDAVKRLSDEPKSDGLDDLFGSANTLHINFYENWMKPTTVSKYLDEVARFVTLMAELE